jgi:PKD repeat protein
MKQSLLLITAIIFYQIGFTQQHELDYTNVREGEDVEYCKTHKEMKKLLMNPVYLKMHAADQAMLKKREEQMKTEKQQGTVYTFPLVFHVLHNGGTENISKEQIEDAVSILNRDYRLQNTDANNVAAAFQGMPSDVEIEFVLATKAPNGACFSGITRTTSPLAFDGSSGQDQIQAITSGNDVYQGNWPGDDYLNIYVVAEAGGAAGYTTTPSMWSQSSMFNGIWILHNYTGSIGTSAVYASRALTHEVGHWLNLSHTWGPNNNPGNSASCNDDDQVSDTPNTIGVTACNLNENSCGPLANVQNYMDYSYCSKMFTQGQVDRMRSAATSSIRDNHWSTSNLNNVGAISNPPLCKADFSTTRFTICQGETLDFTDESFNGAISSWNWTFDGGTPSTSSDQHPSITYNTPGTHNVILNVSDGPTSLTETKIAYITVAPSTGNNLPIFEGFENAASVPNSGWQVENSDGGTTWQITSTASDLGTKSVKLNNYSNNEEGDIDELISMPYDLSNMASVTMTFSYAFAQKSTSNTDKLQILASDDCGANWAVRKSIAASQMTTTGGSTVSGNFVPTDAQWKDITVTSIVGGFLTDGFKYKFLFSSGKGNNLYLDNINIYGTDSSGNQVGSPTSITEFINVNDVNVYPNPANDNVSIAIDLTNRQELLSVGIYDLLGKKVLSVFEGNEIEGQHVYNASTKSLSSGMYLVLIDNGNSVVSQKLIIK